MGSERMTSYRCSNNARYVSKSACRSAQVSQAQERPAASGTNRSGIIVGGVIGGQQTGKWLKARFNKTGLIHRIRLIARDRTRIKLYNLDAPDFTNDVDSKIGSKTVAFFDPPYIES